MASCLAGVIQGWGADRSASGVQHAGNFFKFSSKLLHSGAICCWKNFFQLRNQHSVMTHILPSAHAVWRARNNTRGCESSRSLQRSYVIKSFTLHTLSPDLVQPNFLSFLSCRNLSQRECSVIGFYWTPEPTNTCQWKLLMIAVQCALD